MLALAHRRLSPCTFIFPRPDLCENASAGCSASRLLRLPPRDKFEQRGQPSCDAVPSISVGGPEERRAGIWRGEVNPGRPYSYSGREFGRVNFNSNVIKRSVKICALGGWGAGEGGQNACIPRVGIGSPLPLLILRQMVNRERVDVTAALSRCGGRRKPSRATISW